MNHIVVNLSIQLCRTMNLRSTCQNPDLNEDLGPPGADEAKGLVVAQQTHQGRQLLLRTGQPQMTQPQHCLTAATRGRHRSEEEGGRKREEGRERGSSGEETRGVERKREEMRG